MELTLLNIYKDLNLGWYISFGVLLSYKVQ